jgi:hypothetical protein
MQENIIFTHKSCWEEAISKHKNHKLEDSIKMGLREIACELAQKIVQQLSIVSSTVTNFP